MRWLTLAAALVAATVLAQEDDFLVDAEPLDEFAVATGFEFEQEVPSTPDMPPAIELQPDSMGEAEMGGCSTGALPIPPSHGGPHPPIPRWAAQPSCGLPVLAG